MQNKNIDLLYFSLWEVQNKPKNVYIILRAYSGEDIWGFGFSAKIPNKKLQVWLKIHLGVLGNYFTFTVIVVFLTELNTGFVFSYLPLIPCKKPDHSVYDVWGYVTICEDLFKTRIIAEYQY